MITTRKSSAVKPNPELREQKSRRGETNSQWISRTNLSHGVVLIGGCSLADFRIRVAQSHVRADLLPSVWSTAGLLYRDSKEFFTVSFDFRTPVSAIPGLNAIESRAVMDFDNSELFPNVAVIQFSDNASPILGAVEQLKGQRNIVDLPRLVVEWLGFVWGVGQTGNPLLRDIGVPSAALVEAAHAMAGIEVTPGLASEASCPEAIWQATKWWHEFYESAQQIAEPGASGAKRPVGCYVIRDDQPRVIAP